MSDIDRDIASAAGLSISRRGLIAGAGTALLASSAFARPARAQAKSRLVFALSSYPPSIRPWQNTGTAAATVKLALYCGLLSYDARGEIRGELAESWRRENDHTWSFTLRSGARFQDGEPVTPDAVRFTFDQILGEKSTAFMKGRLRRADREDRGGQCADRALRPRAFRHLHVPRGELSLPDRLAEVDRGERGRGGALPPGR
jgi:ABC-type transport system substrate-binding protein